MTTELAKLALNAGRTAITRSKLSIPIRKLVADGLISGSVLHHGSGRAVLDSAALRKLAIGYGEFDPTYANFPENLAKRWDTVVSNYVLNTLPPRYRTKAWEQLADTTGRNAFISVRAAGDKSIRGVPFQDGVRTSIGTFQKGYTTEDFLREAARYYRMREILYGGDNQAYLTLRARR